MHKATNDGIWCTSLCHILILPKAGQTIVGRKLENRKILQILGSIRGSLHKFLKDLWNFTCKQLLQFYHYLGVSINSGDFKSNFKVIFGYFYLEQDLTISSQALTEEKLNCVGPAMYLGFVFPSVNQCTITYQWLEIGRRPYMVCSFYLTSNYYIMEQFERRIRC